MSINARRELNLHGLEFVAPMKYENGGANVIAYLQQEYKLRGPALPEAGAGFNAFLKPNNPSV